MKLARLGRLSAFARAESHLVQQTTSGAIVTILGVCLAALLFSSELSHFLTAQQTIKMGVDMSRNHTVRAHFNVTMPSLPCALLSIDVVDIAGDHDDDTTMSVAHNGEVHKMRLDTAGKRIGYKEYIPPKRPWQDSFILRRGGGMDTSQWEVDMINKALDANEGCHIWGWLDLQRVAGNFHISVHAGHFFAMRSTQEDLQKAIEKQINELSKGQGAQQIEVGADTSHLNMSHIIHSVSFGPAYPSQVNPLDGHGHIIDHDAAIFKYFLKIVPTWYRKPRGAAIETNQYSVTEYEQQINKGNTQMPAIYFMYDFSPVSVDISVARGSLTHFLVRTCAVVGGVFAVTGMVDKMVYRLSTTVSKQSQRYSRPAS